MKNPKLIITTVIVILWLMLLLSGCTNRTCATYSSTDTIPATHADLEEYMRQDTTPHTFSNLEKIGAGIFSYLLLTTIIQQTDNNDGKAWKIVPPVVIGLMVYGAIKYTSESNKLGKHYRHIKDSVSQTIQAVPPTSSVREARRYYRKRVKEIADSLHTPMLKKHGYYMD